MHQPGGWQFDVEVHPLAWRFPAGKTWIAGWIRPPSGQVITDIRARLHHRVILGLCGLPHPAFNEGSAVTPEPCRPGFSFLLAPQPGATRLRLEARDRSGRWTEFFGTGISAAPGAPVPSPTSLSPALPRLVTELLRRRMRAAHRSWTELADELVMEFVAEPLNAHPNPPFVGALEEPHDVGRLRYGLIPVTGWLAHPGAKITRLSAVIDPLPAKLLPHGLARQDIAGTFPALAAHSESAFVGEIALPPDLAVPVLLKIFVELDRGEAHLAFAQRFFPRHHGDSGKMPALVSGATFLRAVWALHRSAKRYGLVRLGLIKEARAIWTGYQSLPAYRPKDRPPLRARDPFQSKTGPNRRSRDDTGVPSAGGATAPEAAAPATTVIAPADDMCVPDASQYFHLGREALRLVQDACALTEAKRIGAILDLPCGYGRVARWLRTAYPTARLTACDIQEPAVAFCIEQLGAVGVQAAVDGSHWGALAGPYDIIWCGSLLTHLGRDQWVEHLRRFAERLAPHGALVFTSHGLLALDKLQSGEKDYGLSQALITRLCAAAVADGFGYVDYPDTPGYGISVSQPSWVLELIAKETELKVVDFREAEWDQHQDVVVCTREPDAPGELPAKS